MFMKRCEQLSVFNVFFWIDFNYNNKSRTANHRLGTEKNFVAQKQPA